MNEISRKFNEWTVLMVRDMLGENPEISRTRYKADIAELIEEIRIDLDRARMSADEVALKDPFCEEGHKEWERLYGIVALNTLKIQWLAKIAA